MKFKALLFIATLIGCESHESYALRSGNVVNFDDLQGRWVLINYWAVWCAPCRKEIPDLNKYARNNSDNVAVYGVNYDGVQGNVLDEQVTSLNIQFDTFLNDPRFRWDLEKSDILPETLIVNENGELRYRLVGPQTIEDLSELIPGTF
jgi:thiol-disulfide isomerase/thioredoxin